jgi:integrase/recombinase XerD
MSALAEAVNDYLALRRALGYKLEAHGRVLPQFAEFLEQRDATVITTALALEWATEPANGSVVWWHQRLAIVRGFARYLQASDPRHEVPPINLLPAKFRRAVPYLYSEAEIESLMHAADRISSPLKAATYQTLIGLLAVTGMRIGEAIALDRSDVELLAGRLTVHHGKHGRSREVASPDHGHGAGRLRPCPRRALPAREGSELPNHHHRRATASPQRLERVRPAAPRDRSGSGHARAPRPHS